MSWSEFPICRSKTRSDWSLDRLPRNPGSGGIGDTSCCHWAHPPWSLDQKSDLVNPDIGTLTPWTHFPPLSWKDNYLPPYRIGKITGANLHEYSQHSKRYIWGVPIMVQWKRIWLGTLGLRVHSLASLSGLRIWCCCGSGVGQQL